MCKMNLLQYVEVFGRYRLIDRQTDATEVSIPHRFAGGQLNTLFVFPVYVETVGLGTIDCIIRNYLIVFLLIFLETLKIKRRHNS